MADSGYDTSSDDFCPEQLRVVRRRPSQPDTAQQGAADAMYMRTPTMVALSPEPAPSSPMSDDAQSQPRPGKDQEGVHAVDAPMAMERRSRDPPPPRPESGARWRCQPTRYRALTLRPPYTVESIFDYYSKRREALIRDLTEDEEAFFHKCDLGMQPLYLYGGTDESWEVKPPEFKLPAPEVEPTLGINIIRDTMERHKWLEEVAVHCDAWLMKICGFTGSYMTATERGRLFAMIISLPTVQETLLYHEEGKRSSGPDEANNEVVEEEHEVYLIEDQRSSGPTEANEVLGEAEDDSTTDDNNFCASCNSHYNANAFWICCDECGKWYHGKCVNITSSEAEHLGHYECPDCYFEKVGHDYNKTLWYQICARDTRQTEFV